MPDFQLKYKIMRRDDSTFDVVEMTGPDRKEFLKKFGSWEKAAEFVESLPGGEVPVVGVGGE